MMLKERFWVKRKKSMLIGRMNCNWVKIVTSEANNVA